MFNKKKVKVEEKKTKKKVKFLVFGVVQVPALYSIPGSTFEDVVFDTFSTKKELQDFVSKQAGSRDIRIFEVLNELEAKTHVDLVLK